MQNVRERDTFVRRQLVIARNHHDQPVDGEGAQVKVGGIDRIRKNADLRQSGRDGSRDLNALPLLQFDVDLRVSRHPRAEPFRQKLGERGRVTASRTVARRPLACSPSSPRICAIWRWIKRA